MDKILVVYYSFTGNSKKVAEYVQNKLNADILELEPAVPFSSDYDEVVSEWQNNDVKRDVDIKPINVDLSKYNKVVLITCTWWYGISQKFNCYKICKRNIKGNWRLLKSIRLTRRL